MPTVTIPYGSKEISVSIPDVNYLETISPRTVQPSDDEETIIKAALNHPHGSTRLEEITKPGG
jgi:hypothetical protein